ncbi:hypothetical protein TSA1_04985 [Bradyrhizobium nitroreducens]|uniref:Uncharacterized protein n=1 Tax=Bradyrhizobium nitroreducens TaxID=709803 RepID=A0A2M6U6K2_9BRAD|nr:hypothetical protein TSA1_04985 [Bradyrhizobium nitroreducens]
MASHLQRKSPAIGLKAPFPGFVEPALASSVERVPSSEREPTGTDEPVFHTHEEQWLIGSLTH